MGRGDKKTKRGKIAIGTYGKLRPKRKKFKVKPTTMADTQKKNLEQ
ncbi:30S ribosomal protein THX [Autumnicola edwardsiae]|uniref:30S ribosomal protein THX n=1 Tax=Autumnicola edwardsiae TaxID=3075594 RepID=A0ABU3CR46_9FLAO|nr:30S ribosomal protein THX [Zunongwangia sp. F297]MDT0648766.1 30S ribosomal protein THX [Zunongwangia sp. F297]